MQAQTGKVKSAQKNAEKIERFEKIFYQKTRKYVVKKRIRMQDKITQKRMVEARKRANKFNRRRNDIFFIKFLKKRKVKK